MFVVFSLPRSRSAWLSHYLASSGDRVGHDIGIDCRHPDDFIKALKRDYIGTCETGAMMGWRLLRYYLPEVKFITVRRDRREVLQSLGNFGLVGRELEEDLERKDAMLDMIQSLPGTFHLNFWDLSTPEAAGALFEFCTGKPFEFLVWQSMNNVNIQVDMGMRLNKLVEKSNDLALLKAEVIQRQNEIFKGLPCPILN